MDVIAGVLEGNGLVLAFLLVGVLILISNYFSRKLTRGRLQGSAIAITVGLVLAYFGGLHTGASAAWRTSRSSPGSASWADPCCATSPSSRRPTGWTWT